MFALTRLHPGMCKHHHAQALLQPQQQLLLLVLFRIGVLCRVYTLSNKGHQDPSI